MAMLGWPACSSLHGRCRNRRLTSGQLEFYFGLLLEAIALGVTTASAPRCASAPMANNRMASPSRTALGKGRRCSSLQHPRQMLRDRRRRMVLALEAPASHFYQLPATSLVNMRNGPS